MYSIMSSANSDNFTSFPTWILKFIFLLWLPWVGLPKLCWIKVVRVNILVLFLILEKILSGFHCWMLCEMCVWHMAFIRLRYVSYVCTLLKVIIINELLCQIFPVSIDHINFTQFMWYIRLVCRYWTFLLSLGLILLEHFMDDPSDVFLSSVY